MTAEDIAKAIKQDREAASRYVFQYGDRLSAHPRADALLHKILAECPSAADVEHISFSSHWQTGQPTLSLYLRDCRKDSALPREVVQALGGKLEKSPSGEGLCCSGEYMRLGFNIYGYLPKTCHLEYREEYIPGHTARVAKVICEGGNVSDAD